MGLKNVVINIGAGSWQAVSVYIIVLAVISFASVLGLKELTRADISRVDDVRIEEVALAGED